MGRYIHDFITNDRREYCALYEPYNRATDHNMLMSELYGPNDDLWFWYGSIVVVALEGGRLKGVEPAKWPSVRQALRQ